MNKKINRLVAILLVLGILITPILGFADSSEDKISVAYDRNREIIQVRGRKNTPVSIIIMETKEKGKENPELKLLDQSKINSSGIMQFKVELKDDKLEKKYVVYARVGDKTFESETLIVKPKGVEDEKLDGRVRVTIKDDRGRTLDSSSRVEFYKDDTIYDVTDRFLKTSKIRRYDMRNGSISYIEDLRNGSEGEWRFTLNGISAIYDSDRERVRNNDDIVWEFITKKTEKKEDKKEEKKETVDKKLDTTKEGNNLFNKASQLPYIDGYKDETFRPENNASREEVASMVYKIIDKKELEKNKTKINEFNDVDENRWSNEYVSTLSKMDLLSGYPDGGFDPGGNISRGEVATIIFRATGLKEESNNIFNDLSDYWGKDYVNAIAKEGWINGYPDGDFRPDENITRAELVTMLNRALDKKKSASAVNRFKDLDENAWYYEEVIKASSN